MEPANPDQVPKCPECGSKLAKVLETREQEFRGYKFKIRVKRCDHCKFQYRTKNLITPETMADEDITLPSPSKEGRYKRPDPPAPPSTEPDGPVFPPV